MATENNISTVIASKPLLRGTKQSVFLIPKLRFKEFEGNWEKYKVGELCDCIVPGRNKPKKFRGDIAWITTPDIEHSSYIYKSKSGLGISKEEAKNVGSKIVPKDSVIISCVGDLGLVAIAGVELVINQQLHAFLPSEKINHRFLMHSITTQTKYIDKVATKTAVPYMNKGNCNSIPIYKPLLPEQQKIATFLTAVDTKLQQLKSKKNALETYKKGAMQQLFSQQIRFKADDGSDFVDWEEKKLGEISNIIMGQSPESKSYNENGDGVFLIQGNADLKNRLTKPRQWTNEPTKKCQIGDLIMTVRAPVGSISKSLHNACIGRGVCSIKNNNKSSIEYLYQFLLSYELKWVRLEQGSTFTAVSGADIKSIKIKLPFLKEQQKIATYLSAIDVKIESIQLQIEKTQAFKKGLLQQLFD